MLSYYIIRFNLINAIKKMNTEINQQRKDKDHRRASNDLDKELNELRLRYSEMKKDREKSQKDELFISNKMRLLSQEEAKIEKNQRSKVHHEDNLSLIRVSLLQDKEKLEQVKKERNQSLTDKKRAINIMKTRNKEVLNQWRSSITSQNQNEALKVKNERSKIEEMIQLNKEEATKKVKTIHDKVLSSSMTKEERMKKREMERKQKIIKDFEAKIEEEANRKKQIDKRITQAQEESSNIVNRIHHISEVSPKQHSALKKSRKHSGQTFNTSSHSHTKLNSSAI